MRRDHGPVFRESVVELLGDELRRPDGEGHLAIPERDLDLRVVVLGEAAHQRLECPHRDDRLGRLDVGFFEVAVGERQAAPVGGHQLERVVLAIEQDPVDRVASLLLRRGEHGLLDHVDQATDRQPDPRATDQLPLGRELIRIIADQLERTPTTLERASVAVAAQGHRRIVDLTQQRAGLLRWQEHHPRLLDFHGLQTDDCRQVHVGCEQRDRIPVRLDVDVLDDRPRSLLRGDARHRGEGFLELLPVAEDLHRSTSVVEGIDLPGSRGRRVEHPRGEGSHEYIKELVLFFVTRFRVCRVN